MGISGGLVSYFFTHLLPPWGYTGIANSIAVEFDTYYNAELLEPYENHVSVHTRGWRHANSADASAWTKRARAGGGARRAAVTEEWDLLSSVKWHASSLDLGFEQEHGILSSRVGRCGMVFPP